jgi:hypothetical protein
VLTVGLTEGPVADAEAEAEVEVEVPRAVADEETVLEAAAELLAEPANS